MWRKNEENAEKEVWQSYSYGMVGLFRDIDELLIEWRWVKDVEVNEEVLDGLGEAEDVVERRIKGCISNRI